MFLAYYLPNNIIMDLPKFPSLASTDKIDLMGDTAKKRLLGISLTHDPNELKLKQENSYEMAREARRQAILNLARDIAIGESESMEGLSQEDSKE